MTRFSTWSIAKSTMPSSVFQCSSLVQFWIQFSPLMTVMFSREQALYSGIPLYVSQSKPPTFTTPFNAAAIFLNVFEKCFACPSVPIRSFHKVAISECKSTYPKARRSAPTTCCHYQWQLTQGSTCSKWWRHQIRHKNMRGWYGRSWKFLEIRLKIILRPLKNEWTCRWMSTVSFLTINIPR